MTTIINKERTSSIRFEDVKVGDFFKYQNSVHLKTNRYYSVDVNAFNLSEKDECFFEKDDLVQAVNTTVTVEPW